NLRIHQFTKGKKKKASPRGAASSLWGTAAKDGRLRGFLRKGASRRPPRQGGRRGFRTTRSTSGPGRSACSAGCRRGTRGTPPGLRPPSAGRRLGNAPLSSETHVEDFDVFPPAFAGFAELASPFLPPAPVPSALPSVAGLALSWSFLAA